MVGRGARRPAAAEVTSLATARAAIAMASELGAEASPALVRSLDAALGELRRAGATPADLAAARHARAALLARLLEHSHSSLERAGFFDDRAAGFVAAALADHAESLEGIPPIVIEGLFEWDPSAFAWVESLARRAPVTVRMPRFPGAPADIGALPEALLSQLENRWHDQAVSPELDLVSLELPRDLTLVEGANDAAEARAIAGAIADALAGGVPADGIAVVVPSLDEAFLEPLRAELAEANVIFDEPRGRPPIAAPAPRAALGWLDFVSAPLERDTLIDLLRTEVVDPAAFIAEPHRDARRRRALSLARRLSRLPARCDRQGTLLVDLLEADVSSKPEDAWMVEALSSFARARGELGRPAPRRAHLDKLVETWRAFGLLETAERGLAAFLRAGSDRDEARLFGQLVFEETQGMRALLEAADRSERAARSLGDGDELVTVQRLRGELEAALAGVAPRATRRPGAVRIARAPDVAWLRTELLLVARASHGTFEPASYAHPLLDDALVSQLPAGRRPLPAHLRRVAHMAELLTAMGSAVRVVVSRSATDSDGRPVPASPLFAELAPSRSPRKEPASPFARSGPPLSSRMAELCALHRGEAPADPEVERRVAIETTRQAFFLDSHRPPGEQTGGIDVQFPGVRAHLARALGGTEDRPIAATTIERAALCRFAVFGARVLGAAPDEMASEELEPSQRGSLVHRALKVALDTMRALRPRLTDRPELVTAVMAKVAKEMVRPKSAPLYRAEVERALRDVAAVLEWTLDDVSGFEFAHAELAFGERGSAPSAGAWPALVIGSQGEKTFIRGRIDRVDRSREGARLRVIDYKTGSLPAWKDVGRLLFQPPLYADAVRWQTGPLGLSEVRALYLDTSKRPPKPLPSGSAQVFTKAAIEAAQNRVAELVARLRRGDVAPRPAEASACGRCDVRSICRRPAALPVEELDPDAEEQGP
jgi:RecB family exonuclease